MTELSGLKSFTALGIGEYSLPFFRFILTFETKI